MWNENVCASTSTVLASSTHQLAAPLNLTPLLSLFTFQHPPTKRALKLGEMVNRKDSAFYSWQSYCLYIHYLFYYEFTSNLYLTLWLSPANFYYRLANRMQWDGQRVRSERKFERSKIKCQKRLEWQLLPLKLTASSLHVQVLAIIQDLG